MTSSPSGTPRAEPPSVGPASQRWGERSRAGRGRLLFTPDVQAAGAAARRIQAAEQRAERERVLAELDPTAEQVAAAEAFCARKEPLPAARPFVPRFA